MGEGRGRIEIIRNVGNDSPILTTLQGNFPTKKIVILVHTDLMQNTEASYPFKRKVKLELIMVIKEKILISQNYQLELDPKNGQFIETFYGIIFHIRKSW